jgi:hypothetical protein
MSRIAFGSRFMGSGRSAMRALAILVSCSTALPAAEVLRADGTRVAVKEPRKDSKGDWTGELEGRRTILKPGESAVVIDDEGAEHENIPPLEDAAMSEPADAALAALKSVAKHDGPEVLFALARLSEYRTTGMRDALVALLEEKDRHLRTVAIRGLGALLPKETVARAARAVLDEKDRATRRATADSLFAVQVILRRADCRDTILEGIADADAEIRIKFALLAPPEIAEAIPVLRKDGLKHADHHVRESAALELGRRGDAGGEDVLIAMLARALPKEATTGSFEEGHFIAEKVAICAMLGGLGSEKSKAALSKAAKSKLPAVAAAASAALGG